VHYAALVVCPAGTTVDDHAEHVEALLAPYSEDLYEGDVINPRARWDFWTVGGRWRDYFPVAAGLGDGDRRQLVAADAGADHVAGGPKRSLGLAALADEGGRAAEQLWDAYAEAVRGTDRHTYWSSVVARFADADPADQVARQRFDQARSDYWDQPRILALEEHAEFEELDADEIDMLDRSTRAEYVQYGRDKALVPLAVVTADGEWATTPPGAELAPGDSVEEAAARFARQMGRYLTDLDEDTFLVVVDCHV
jgi:hypothetical protein